MFVNLGIYLHPQKKCKKGKGGKSLKKRGKSVGGSGASDLLDRNQTFHQTCWQRKTFLTSLFHKNKQKVVAECLVPCGKIAVHCAKVKKWKEIIVDVEWSNNTRMTHIYINIHLLNEPYCQWYSYVWIYILVSPYIILGDRPTQLISINICQQIQIEKT